MRLARLLWGDGKDTVTQINTCYNQDVQNSISEHTKGQTLNQMVYRSKKPQWVPLQWWLGNIAYSNESQLRLRLGLDFLSGPE